MAAVFGLCSLVASEAQAGERVLRLGYLFSQTSQLGAGAERFATEVAARTGGAVRVEPYPNGTVGGEVEMVEELRAGHLDMAFITSAPFAGILPEFGVFDIPFLFRNAAHAHAVFDGPIGRDYLQKFSAKGLVALAWGENGMRHITNAKRPIAGPEDLKGLSMRVPQSEIMLTGFRSLGVKAEPLAFPALYGALQSGQFDGQENPIAVITASHFAKVQRHLTLSGHVYSWAALVMSRSAWDALTEDERAAFTQAARLGGQVSREVAGKAEREGVEALRKSGMSVVATIDRAAFERSLEAASAGFSKTFGAETIRQIKSVQ
ncbi:tripartite ATP-independent transporter DctP family solute receptor [Methylorubrum rhodinum]|uniref:Tripartite ATP-independent transporter DctP family solute receptor n=1 Tax=Methylorubrum rhodinum TaxID=29428 RepID=A0A840ZMG0_9HYPH|nr:DctP family TRAP transporter solute-binding subunit [Methylorubrum rhodinum]MBB5758097.1 tripartite ATP-independent transporter DctP family solute receptor [Methylorubrum rhodinum]